MQQQQQAVPRAQAPLSLAEAEAQLLLQARGVPTPRFPQACPHISLSCIRPNTQSANQAGGIRYWYRAGRTCATKVGSWLLEACPWGLVVRDQEANKDTCVTSLAIPCVASASLCVMTPALTCTDQLVW